MNVTDVLDHLQIPYKLHGENEHVSNGWCGIDCSSCSRDWGHFRCGINLATGACNCWSCGRLGLASVLSDSSGVRYGEVKDLLRGLDRLRPVDRPRGTYKGPAGLEGQSPPLSLCHTAYLMERHLNPDEIVRLWEVAGGVNHPRIGWNLFIPVIQGGERVSWTSRRVSACDPGQRYRSALAGEEAVPIKQTLYGEDYCRNGILVCEGPFDVWAVGPGAVCTFGTAYTAAQAARVARFPRRAVCFDAEPAAQAQARRLCDQLSVLPGITVNVVLETGKDPSGCKRREVAQLRRHFLE